MCLAVFVSASAACGDAASFQILLDRCGFSSGQIDGRIADNTRHALAAFQASKTLPATGEADCDTWRALPTDDSAPSFTTYGLTAGDAKGPFAKRIPHDILQQSHLPTLEYQSLVERLGERFHTAPALLNQLNRCKHFSAGVSIEVSAADSSLPVARADGTTIFFAPVTSGSEHDPLPIGQWRFTSIDWRPAFYYNPTLFWDANPDHSKATIRPGPNNPVGIVWIGITVEHYGMHGTPEPSAVGHAESHGYVRLTNWDAARLATLVAVGTPVIFK
jgi:hypothetical protein